MAKVKLRDLGVVSIIHESGMVETNKGIRANIKAEKGDKLVMDGDRKISIVIPKKTKPPVTTTSNETIPTTDIEDTKDEEK